MRPKFKKGNPGKPKGAISKRTRDAKELAAALIEHDPAYLESLKNRIRAGKAPHMETLLWYYRYGKPKEQIEHAGIAGGAIQIVHEYASNLDAEPQR